MTDNQFWHDPVIQHRAPFRWRVVFRSKTEVPDLAWWYWSRANAMAVLDRWAGVVR